MPHTEPDTGGTYESSPRVSSPPASPVSLISEGTFPPAIVPGWDFAFHAELDSTNLEAKRRIAQGQTGNFLVIAERQTKGQCRHDRLWESPPDKGIWASFSMPVSVPLEYLPQSTLVLAVAVRDGICEATNLSLNVKWPNDLLGSGQKCCGLLVETPPGNLAGQTIPLVLGVGVNCNHGADDFPPYLRGAAVSLSMLADGKRFSRSDVLLAVARSITRWFGVWRDQGFSPVREAWLAYNCTLGKTILLPEGYGCSQAIAQTMDASGALLAVAATGQSIRIDSGEILFADGVGSARERPAAQ